MVKTRQTGQARWVSLLVFGLGMTVVTGCSSTPTASAPPVDPLYGLPPGTPPPNSAPKAEAATSPSPQALNQNGIPVLPASNPSTNPATLAAASGQRPLGTPLAINDNNSSGPPFLPASMTQQQGPLPANPNPKVEPVPDIKPPPTITPIQPASSWQGPTTNQPVQTTSAAQPASVDALSKQLEARGVINEKQTAVPEGLRLTCYVSSGPGTPLRIVEATGPDYATAAQAILQKIETAH